VKNLGHRLGASGTILENTIEGFRNSFDLVSDNRFKYWEFDVRESSDEVLFVFHDDHIPVDGSMVETRKLNFVDISKAGNSIKISIPTFEQVVEAMGSRKERVMIEIKNVHSDTAREELLSSVSGKKDWMLMSTPERFLQSFPSETRKHWNERADELGVKLVRVGRHRVDLFNASKHRISWYFAAPEWFFGF
jgi:glycerophosphoryl diester phosphodiesterase